MAFVQTHISISTLLKAWTGNILHGKRDISKLQHKKRVFISAKAESFMHPCKERSVNIVGINYINNELSFVENIKKCSHFHYEKENKATCLFMRFF